MQYTLKWNCPIANKKGKDTFKLRYGYNARL